MSKMEKAIIEFVRQSPDARASSVILGCCVVDGVVDYEKTRALVVSLIDQGRLDYSVNGVVSLPTPRKRR